MSFLISLELAESTSVDFLKFLFLFVVFLVRIWLAKALLRLTFPEAVSENRLAAPLCVFTFGIFLSSFTYCFFGDKIITILRPSNLGS